MVGPSESRRRFLRLGSTLAIAGIAGCFRGSDSETTPTEALESETPTQTWARDPLTESDVGTEPPARPETRTSTPSRTTATDESLWDEPLPCEHVGQSVPVDIPRVTDQTTSGDLDLTIPNAWLAEAVLDRNGFTNVLTGDDSRFSDDESRGQYVMMELNGIYDLTGLTVTLTYSPPVLAPLITADVDFYRPPRTTASGGPTLIAIPVPSRPYATMSAHFETPFGKATWDVPARFRDHFPSVPEFSLLDATISTPCEEAQLVVTVRNTGDRDGIWRGLTAPEALDDGSNPIRIPVPAGTAVRQAVEVMQGPYTDPLNPVKVTSIDEERRFIRWRSE